MKKLIALPLLLIIGFGCSNTGIHGEYTAQGPSVIEKLRFLSGSEVELSNMIKTSMGEYKVQGSRVVVTANGDTVVFLLSDDKNCLEHVGGVLGVYCKN